MPEEVSEAKNASIYLAAKVANLREQTYAAEAALKTLQAGLEIHDELDADAKGLALRHVRIEFDSCHTDVRYIDLSNVDLQEGLKQIAGVYLRRGLEEAERAGWRRGM